MLHKSIRKKTNSPKNNRVNTRVIAEVVGCSPCTVVQVLNGKRSSDTYTGERIQVAQLILEEGIESVIVRAKSILQIT